MRPNMVYRILLLLCALAAADTVPKCDRSLLRGVPMAEIDREQHTYATRMYDVTVKCVNVENAPRAIVHNSTLLFLEIACNSKGWHGITGEHSSQYSQWLAEASEPLDISCEKFCEWTGTGVTEDKFENKPQLQCTNSSQGIFYNGLLLAKGTETKRILCLPTRWMLDAHRPYPITITTDTAIPQRFVCKEVSDCTLPLVDGPHQLHYDKQTKKLTCDTSEDAPTILKETGDFRDGFKSVICDNGTWKYDDNEEPYPKWDFLCATYCEVYPSEGVRQVITFVGSEKHVEISCENEKLELQHGTRVPGDRAACSLAGWKNGYNAVLSDANVFRQSSFYCEKVARCSTQGGYSRVEISRHNLNAGEISPEQRVISGWEYRCTQSDNAMTAITTHSKRYRVLVCAHQPPGKLNGWIGTDSVWTEANYGRDGNSVKVIGPYDERLDITCVDYCKVAGTATNITWTVTVAHVSCKEPNDYLIYGGDRVIPGGVTYCNLWKGWMIGSGKDESSHVLLTSDTETTAQFDCSSDLPTTPTVAPSTTTTTPMTTAAPAPVADSTTAPGGMIAIILLLALFRSLYMSN